MKINGQKNIRKKLFLYAKITAALISVILLVTIVQKKPNDPQGATITSTDKKTRFNFLLMGVDNSERLADVIMLASLDTEKNTLAIMQIPRDTYAEYTTAAYRKLNGAISSLGGGSYVRDFLEASLGIGIDHYVTVDLDAIAQTVDLIGGVEVDIPEDMIYVDEYQGLEIKLNAGKQLLDGEKAKQFIRYRSGYVRGDIARLDAQKIFLAALGEKLMERNAVGLIGPVMTLISNSKSDLSFDDCVKFVSKATKIEGSSIILLTMPGGDVKTESGTWYYILNKNQTHLVLRKYFSCELSTEEFDRDKLFTGAYSEEFNRVYSADKGYEPEIYSADGINIGGIEIERTEN